MEQQPEPNQSHWGLFRDVVVFQAKLVLDGLRDLLMSPVSLLAALLGILTERDRPGRYFYETLSFGRKTEQWINLFGRFDQLQDADEPASDGSSADELVKKMEKMVVDHYNKGGLTASAKQVIDRSLNRLHENIERREK